MIALTMPLPPSSNHRLMPNGNGRLILSPKYRAWLNSAIAQIRKQLPMDYQPLSGRLYSITSVTFPDRRKRDTDNPLKGVKDALTQAGVIEDDEQLTHDHIFKRLDKIDKDNPHVFVILYEETDPEAELFRVLGARVDVVEEGYLNRWK